MVSFPKCTTFGALGSMIASIAMFEPDKLVIPTKKVEQVGKSRFSFFGVSTFAEFHAEFKNNLPFWFRASGVGRFEVDAFVLFHVNSKFRDMPQTSQAGLAWVA